MINYRKILVVLIVALTVCSCRSREVAYLKDAQRDSAQEILKTYASTIMPGDHLYIYVASQTPQSVIPFNQETHKLVVENSGLEQEAKNVVVSEVSGYLVTERGTITFPILGELTVIGITQDSLCRYIENRLISEGYVVDPLVTTKLMNFRVTVVGEVNKPQQIHVDGTRLTIFEALAICGDLTDYGQRENVTVVRNDNGVQTVGEINLTKQEILESPYYYLHNNDIVYIEPNKRRKRDAVRDPNIPNYLGIGVNVLHILRTSIRIATYK